MWAQIPDLMKKGVMGLLPPPKQDINDSPVSGQATQDKVASKGKSIAQLINATGDGDFTFKQSSSDATCQPSLKLVQPAHPQGAAARNMFVVGPHA